MKLSREYASELAPIQFAFEVFAAICLFCGFFRLPMYWLTTGLLALLMFIEFGVPAAWPPTSTCSVNWLWELLLPTSILFLASMNESIRLLSGKMSWLDFFFGRGRYHSVSGIVKLEWVVLLSVLSLILFVFDAKQNLFNQTLTYTVLMTLGLMLILLLCDPWRAVDDTEACEISSKRGC